MESQEQENGKLIFQLIPKIMADIGPIGKGQYNSQQKFNFRGIDDIYNHCQSVLAKHGVFTSPFIVNRHREQIMTKSGGRAYLVVNSFRFRFYASDGSYFDAFADGEAIDMGDKASNKAAAIAHKYALLQVFCIPTQELTDPDGESFQIAPKPSPDFTSKPPGYRAPQPQHTVRNLLRDNDRIEPASQKQIKFCYGRARDLGIDKKDVARFIRYTHGVSDLESLNKREIQDVIEWLLTGEEKKSGSMSNSA